MNRYQKEAEDWIKDNPQAISSLREGKRVFLRDLCAEQIAPHIVQLLDFPVKLEVKRTQHEPSARDRLEYRLQYERGVYSAPLDSIDSPYRYVQVDVFLVPVMG